MKRIVKKIKNNKGESIAETLIALLVSALGIMLLAGMIQTSSKLITNSNDRISKYVEQENAIVEYSGTPTSGTISLSPSNNLTAAVKINSEESSSVSVDYYVMEYGGKNIIVFK